MPRILVIDDERLIRSTIVAILSREGFSIEEAADGRAGLALIHKHRPDVVITDIFMPNKDGIEILMELKRSCPETKIIAMTGGGQSQMIEIAHAAELLGAHQILRKPFEKRDLLHAMSTVLGTFDHSHKPMAT
ncbi:response regulator [Nitrospira moscoviensis]|uniref:Response regulator receiver domain n=1 Tax=Nitrospira moscoviensis TaxID=42253 RepID=A0A0K2GGA3_NITMO|nr:response regulator [Nitrospira moscoviensis]ALA59657.1 Response regulator receiver domain [Nitrospira moscoviensis]